MVDNTQEQKNFYKKQNGMASFPQIFMKVDKDNYMKIGGNDNLIEILKLSKTIKESDVSLDSIYYMYQNLYKK